MLNKYTLHSYHSTDSTQAQAKRMYADSALNHGDVVQADLQSAGVGRYAREWISPPGNLYVTIALKPELSIEHWSKISYVTAIALSDALMSLDASLEIRLKWVNDLLIDDKKIAGILLTNVDNTFLLIGVGLNILSNPALEELGAIAMKDVSDRFNADNILLMVREQFLEKFQHYYNFFLEKSFIPIKNIWLKSAYKMGQRVTIRFRDKQEIGVFVGIDDNGRLKLLQNDKVSLIDAGELFLL